MSPPPGANSVSFDFETPFGEGSAPMQYYQLPEDLLEDPEALRPWTDGAVAVARRAKQKKAGSKRKR